MDWKDALRNLDLPQGPDDDDAAAPQMPQEPEPKAPKQRLCVEKQRKGRAGKTAIVVYGFTLPDEEVERVAATLKKALATGGSVRGGEILIQGDRVDRVVSELRKMGFSV